MATKSTKSKTAATSSAQKISEEDVRKRAFEIFLERGGTPGDETEDWLRAEKELKKELKK